MTEDQLNHLMHVVGERLAPVANKHVAELNKKKCWKADGGHGEDDLPIILEECFRATQKFFAGNDERNKVCLSRS